MGGGKILGALTSSSFSNEEQGAAPLWAGREGGMCTKRSVTHSCCQCLQMARGGFSCDVRWVISPEQAGTVPIMSGH